jgi:hypothetical protein
MSFTLTASQRNALIEMRDLLKKRGIYLTLPQLLPYLATAGVIALRSSDGTDYQSYTTWYFNDVVRTSEESAVVI